MGKTGRSGICENPAARLHEVANPLDDSTVSRWRLNSGESSYDDRIYWAASFAAAVGSGAVSDFRKAITCWRSSGLSLKNLMAAGAP